MTTGSVQTLLLPAVFFRVVPETPGYICSMRRFGVTRNILLHIATTATTWATEATDHGHDDLWGRALV